MLSRVKELSFRAVPFLRDPRGKSRVRLRKFRHGLDLGGVKVLQLISRVFVPFRSRPVAIVPYTTFSGDGITTQNYLGFTEDAQLRASFSESFKDLPASLQCAEFTQMIWRAHICTWGARQALLSDGVFLEFGVWHGILSYTVCDYLQIDPEFQSREFRLVDTWGKVEGGSLNSRYHKDIFESVTLRFQRFRNVKLIRGLVPDILSAVVHEGEKIAYLAIDMNGHEAERATLEYCWDALSPGAFVYFDDYGQYYDGLVETVNEFLQGKPEKLLHLPTGQSFLLKH